MTARTVWLTCVVLVASATVPRAQTLDFISTATASTTGARGIVSVDLNRDGWLDVATANTGRNTVAILFNRGTGRRLSGALRDRGEHGTLRHCRR